MSAALDRDRLPALRGRLRANASLAEISWFGVGGPAELLFQPADEDDLAHFLAQRPADIPLTVIGLGSNLLVRDGGVRGVVIRLGRGFAGIESEGDTLTAGAAATDMAVALVAAETGIAGLEFYSGIPGTIGGALRMNAGAYGSETADVLVSATALDGRGGRHTLAAHEMGFAYRQSGVPADWIFTAARFRGRPGEAAAIRARVEEIAQAREQSQPITARTGGSTFKNPSSEIKAWELIAGAGCRGLRHGGAMVSEQHCNFLINTGDATAADLETLGEMVRERVRAASGITLDWEIRRIGVAAGER